MPTIGLEVSDPLKVTELCEEFEDELVEDVGNELLVDWQDEDSLLKDEDEAFMCVTTSPNLSQTQEWRM